METILKIDGDDFVLTVWGKVAGKERVYIKSAGGKEYGYWDVPAGKYVHTGKSFSSRNWKETFEAAIAAWGATFVMQATTVAAATASKKSDRAELEAYAIKNLELSRTTIREMGDDELWHRVQHDL